MKENIQLTILLFLSLTIVLIYRPMFKSLEYPVSFEFPALIWDGFTTSSCLRLVGSGMFESWAEYRNYLKQQEEINDNCDLRAKEEKEKEQKALKAYCQTIGPQNLQEFRDCEPFNL